MDGFDAKTGPGGGAGGQHRGGETGEAVLGVALCVRRPFRMALGRRIQGLRDDEGGLAKNGSIEVD